MQIFAGFLFLAALIAFWIDIRRRRFAVRLKKFEQRLRKGRQVLARDDLPPEVVALAKRQGVEPAVVVGIVKFNQNGALRQSPGAKEMQFSARQTIAAKEPGFVWRAAFAPVGVMVVADYFVEGEGGLEAQVLGAFPVQTFVGGEAISKGELMRYLGELPWCPDAILVNRALEWQVVDKTTIKVAAGKGAARAEVTFRLNSEGFIATVEAANRPQMQDGAIVERPWLGRFQDYRPAGGRIVPTRAEAAWILDGEEFVYWNGVIRNWAPKRRALDLA